MSAFGTDFDPSFTAPGGTTPPIPPSFPAPTDWPPTGITLRSWSGYLLTQFPLSELPPSCGGPMVQPPVPDGGGWNAIPPPSGYSGGCDPLKSTIDVTLPMLSALTCRDFVTGSDIPAHLLPTAVLAVTLYVEQLVYGTDPQNRSGAMSSAAGNLRSFTAGPYSESYFGPNEVKFEWNRLNPDPVLNSMLLALITPECLANRMAAANGEFPPSFAIQEVDWRTSRAPSGPVGGCWSCNEFLW